MPSSSASRRCPRAGCEKMDCLLDFLFIHGLAEKPVEFLAPACRAPAHSVEVFDAPQVLLPARVRQLENVLAIAAAPDFAGD